MIRLAKSTITAEDKSAVLDILDKEFLGMGPEVKKFETELESFFSRPVVAVNSGTAALHAALQGCEIGRGDEVLVPSLTYVASFQAISATGAIPVPCDVDDSLHMDPEDAAKRVTKNTKAIMPVHYGGSMGRLDALYALAKKNDLRVIEDAAHAFGSSYKKQLVGSVGDIACFSFDGIKNITSGEGGCVVTSDVECLEKIKDLRLLGVSNDSEKRYNQSRSWDFDVTDQGWRYHMSDIMAALGRCQLKRFSDISAKRKRIVIDYDALLTNINNLQVVKQDRENVVPHLYTVLLAEGVERDALRANLESKGIQTGVHYLPNHFLTLYKKKSLTKLPVTEAVYPRLLSLPLHLDLDLGDQEFIASTLQSYLE
jgi:dTDP-4-amino-4,6-dideoxygalactose transaminase